MNVATVSIAERFEQQINYTSEMATLGKSPLLK
jgi:hypothetical protein